MTEEIKNQIFLSGLRILEKKFFDYLYELKSNNSDDNPIEIIKYITLFKDEGQIALTFNMIKGVTLRNDLRREINALFESVYFKDQSTL